MKRLLVAIAALVLCGCTSLGQETRAVPLVAKPIKLTSPVTLDGDDGALALEVERQLDNLGFNVIVPTYVGVKEFSDNKEYTYTESASRFTVRVRSVDLDTCVPEGSRQMHFRVTVYDVVQRKRVYLSDGEYGCRDTIARQFTNWIRANQ